MERRIESRGTSFLIDEVRDEDWEWVTEGLERSFIKSIPPGFRVDTDDIREKVSMEIERLRYNPMIKNELLVARSPDGERAGALWMAALPFQYTGGMRGWVLQIFVEERFQRMGLGKALMGIAEEWTLQLGMNRIGLNVGSGNEEAIAMYQTLGYRVESYGMGKLLMDR